MKRKRVSTEGSRIGAAEKKSERKTKDNRKTMYFKDQYDEFNA
jgi:hypothetical protein